MSEISDRERHLIDGYCSGNLSDEDFKEFEDGLKGSAELRRTLLEYRGIEAALRASASAGVIQPAGSIERETPKAKSFLWPLYSMAAAIAILLTVIGLMMVETSEPPKIAKVKTSLQLDKGVAVLMNSLDAEWEDQVVDSGESLQPGRWKLLKGQVEMEFYSGASVVLEGPAELEILSENGGILHSGKLSAQVPDHAHGFTITSADVKLVDLGTAFGMEVDKDKGTSVHVFEGEVELFELAQQKNEGMKLYAGEAQQISLAQQWSSMKALPENFLSPQELSSKARRNQNESFESWRQEFAKSLKDSRLVVRYDFSRDERRILKNRSELKAHGIDGSVIGARWSDGRWPNKGSLDFKRPGDRVRINIPGTYESMTLASWIRIDGLDNQVNSLMLSDGWDRLGAVHWQIFSSGFMELAVWNDSSQGSRQHSHNHRSPFHVKPSDLGSWIHVAAVYDGEGKLVSFYRNGELIGTEKIQKVVPLEISKSQIGNWSPKGHNEIRNFNGRIDDFAIYREVLPADEIKNLYMSGKSN
jgi:hypothetical protein